MLWPVVDQLCESCCERIANGWWKLRSGEYLTWENPKPERGYQKVRIPVELRCRIMIRDGVKCVQCGAEDGLTIDHIHPESRGGDLSPENLRTLCRSCNSRKGAR
jgi:5-methylcytosine-specific restriction endonuclease McrA